MDSIERLLPLLLSPFALGGGALVIVALGGWWAWRRRARPAAAAPKPRSHGGEAHKLFLQALEMQGYVRSETAGPGTAGAFDLVVRKDRESYLVQLKHWKTPRVGAEAVHQLHTAAKARGAAGGIMVTTGRFGRDAKAMALATRTMLIDGPLLQQMLAKARGRGGASAGNRPG